MEKKALSYFLQIGYLDLNCGSLSFAVAFGIICVSESMYSCDVPIVSLAALVGSSSQLNSAKTYPKYLGWLHDFCPDIPIYLGPYHLLIDRSSCIFSLLDVVPRP